MPGVEGAGPWDRAERAGALLPIGRVINVQGDPIEIVASYADASVTAVLYRAPQGTMHHPRPIGPSELIGGGHGRLHGDLHVTELSPVNPDCTEIVITFDRGAPWEASEIRLPIDRGLTRPFERFLVGGSPRSTKGGVAVAVAGTTAGLVRTETALHIEAIRPDVLWVELDPQVFGAHINSGPGPGALWREWHPPPSPEQQVRRVERRIGNRIEVSLSASTRVGATASARKLTPAEIAKQPPPRARPEPWSAVALPQNQRLAIHGGTSRGGRPPTRPQTRPILHYEAPPLDADSIDLTLRQLWAYTAAIDTVQVPSPRSGEAVDLSGFLLRAEDVAVELIEWLPEAHGYTLRGRCTPQDAWPNVRVLAEDSSAQLWIGNPDEQGTGEFRGGLPAIFAPLFAAPSVTLALRMVARKLAPSTLHIPLTAAEAMNA